MENVDTLFTFCLIIAVSIAVIVAIRVVVASSPKRSEGRFIKNIHKALAKISTMFS